MTKQFVLVRLSHQAEIICQRIISSLAIKLAERRQDDVG